MYLVKVVELAEEANEIVDTAEEPTLSSALESLMNITNMYEMESDLELKVVHGRLQYGGSNYMGTLEEVIT